MKQRIVSRSLLRLLVFAALSVLLLSCGKPTGSSDGKPQTEQAVTPEEGVTPPSKKSIGDSATPTIEATPVVKASPSSEPSLGTGPTPAEKPLVVNQGSGNNASQADAFKYYEEAGAQQGAKGENPEAKEAAQKFKKAAADLGILQPINEYLDLCAVDYKNVGKGKYRLSFLFKVKKDMADLQPMKFEIDGVVDKSHEQLLNEQDRKRGYIAWFVVPKPPTPQWQNGRFLVMSDVLSVPAVPVRFNVRIMTQTGMKPWSPLLVLGWMADPNTPTQ